MNKYIIYHANCIDGFGAAFAAWKKFKNTAKYIPLNHYQKFPDLPKNSEVYVLDFCLESPQKIRELFSIHKKVVILDHHESEYKKIVKEDPSLLCDNTSGDHVVYFSKKLSGVFLAWNYFHPLKKAPDYFSRIQDRDLRQWQFLDTNSVTDTLMSLPKDFEDWNRFTLKELFESGKTISKVKNLLIEDMFNYNFHYAEIDGHIVPVTNSTVYWSDVTLKILEHFPDAPFAAAYYSIDAHTTKWSLRSHKNNGINVAEISKKFGGGGHKDSGGFSAPTGSIKFLTKEEALEKIKKVA